VIWLIAPSLVPVQTPALALVPSRNISQLPQGGPHRSDTAQPVQVAEKPLRSVMAFFAIVDEQAHVTRAGAFPLLAANCIFMVYQPALDRQLVEAPNSSLT
jgi:hypothetical protein